MNNLNNTRYIILSAGHEWNYYSWSNTFNDRNVYFVKSLFPRLLDKIWWKKFFRNKILCNLFWLPYIKWKLKIPKRPTFLIVYDWGAFTISKYCIRKIKDSYPELKIIYIYTNIVKISGSTAYNLLPDLKDYYDQIYAFDPVDAIKYNFRYSKLIYSLRKDLLTDTSYIYDLFYIGQAKDRHEKLIQIYKDAVSDGLKCIFYITGVSENEQFKCNDIVYNTPLTYSQVLDFMDKSRCIVDAIQGESYGLTIKTCEAVMLNKKLVTTNRNVVNEPFYDSSNILIYTGNESIGDFLKKKFNPYTGKDQWEFSPYRLFQQINR